MRRKSKGDREEASRRERSLRQRQDEKIQQERRRAPPSAFLLDFSSDGEQS